jgi:4-aminobutyrate aminotransferase-like enzyme
VLNVGLSHPKVVKAIKDQTKKFTHPIFHDRSLRLVSQAGGKIMQHAAGRYPEGGDVRK